MGTVPAALARDLKRRLELRHGVETGTYTGRGALLLSDVFRSVTTIELSEELARETAAVLRHEPIRVVHGDSREVLRPSTEATFYFLDGHWSAGRTAGEGDECPVLAELDAIGSGHPDDCIVIDDARLFGAPPPSTQVPEWPTLDEVRERLALHWPDHVVLVAHDQIIAVPERARDLAERFAARPLAAPPRRPIRRLRRELWRLRSLTARAVRQSMLRLGRLRPG